MSHTAVARDQAYSPAHGVRLREAFWTWMRVAALSFGGLGDESAPGQDLAAALARDFGSVERWRAEFIAMGKALGGGSGWVLLSWSARHRRL
jgi:superoxide dismutase